MAKIIESGVEWSGVEWSEEELVANEREGKDWMRRAHVVHPFRYDPTPLVPSFDMLPTSDSLSFF